jgi:hypothetical protein
MNDPRPVIFSEVRNRTFDAAALQNIVEALLNETHIAAKKRVQEILNDKIAAKMVAFEELGGFRHQTAPLPYSVSISA